LDPHGAVGYLALERYLKENAGKEGIFLETAHPVKFYDVVEPIIGKTVPMPESIKSIVDLKKQSLKMEVQYESLRSILLQEA